MILNVGPGIAPEVQIPLDATLVQFCETLSNQDYQRLAEAMSARPEVGLRVYDPFAKHFTDVDFLAHFPNVRRLSLDLWSLTNLDGIQNVRELDTFSFGWTKSKAHSLAFLSRFAALRKLYIEGHTKDIDVIAGLSRVERLTLRSITIPGLELLTPMTGLRHLEIKLGGTKNLEALASLGNLQYLELWLIKGLADLSIVAQIPSLEFLFLQALKNVTALPSFAGLRKLRAVYLETMKGLTDLAPIAQAPALENLSLVDMPKLKVEMLRCFVGHPSLRAFSAGLGSLKRNAEAESLVGLPHGDTWLGLTQRASA